MDAGEKTMRCLSRLLLILTLLWNVKGENSNNEEVVDVQLSFNSGYSWGEHMDFDLSVKDQVVANKVSLTEEEKRSLNILRTANGFVFVRGRRKGDSVKQAFFHAIDSCMVFENGMMLDLQIHYVGPAVPVAIFPRSKSPCKPGIPKEQSLSTLVVRVTGVSGEQAPSFKSTLKKLQSSEDGGRPGVRKDDRSFISKYGLYIAVVLIVITLNSKKGNTAVVRAAAGYNQAGGAADADTPASAQASSSRTASGARQRKQRATGPKR
mmetsp:Transcript_6324/g.19086  ORF Transcript_6324/g.19086 Transcript_6324/m.19086 type:complete len:265 (-) Transcript_6324:412-1206(-)